MSSHSSDRNLKPGDPSLYCKLHRLHYPDGTICPICPQSRLTGLSAKIPPHRIQRCPACGQMSLFWYQCASRGECLNLDCTLTAREPADY